MNKVILTAGAKRDLADIKRYIADNLQNPSAALRIVTSITRDLHQLEKFPNMGTPGESEDSPVSYRYLITGNYMSFYYVSDRAVYVDRILYARRDYLALLFGTAWVSDE